MDDKTYVLDATAIRSGMMPRADIDLYTTPGVIEELKRGRIAKDVDTLSSISLRVVPPARELSAHVRDAAKGTGDAGRLSDTDVELLALALEMSGILVTDDYSIQNMAEVLGIEYVKGVEKGISEVYQWEYRCSGCGRRFSDSKVDCPICGSELTIARKPNPPP
jgi:UPF0271 protein